MPDVEALLPLLDRVVARGRVEVDARLYGKLLSKYSRLPGALDGLDWRPSVDGKARMRLFYRGDLGRADGVVAITDPARDETATRRRSWAVLRSGTPSAFVQHGVLQTGVNFPGGGGLAPHSAERLLLWEEAVAPQVAGDPRHRVTGFLKRRVLPPAPWHPEVAAWRRAHRDVVLMCHSFRWRGKRYGAEAVPDYFDMVEAVARARPGTGFLMRAHRAKAHPGYAAREAALAAELPNVIRCEEGRGPLAGATIEDAVDLADRVVSPTSTALLDAAYLGRPVAVLSDGVDLLSELPSVAAAEELEAFLDGTADDGAGLLRARYGAVDENLDRAAGALEDWLGA
jgi:hypothetical protein